MSSPSTRSGIAVQGGRAPADGRTSRPRVRARPSRRPSRRRRRHGRAARRRAEDGRTRASAAAARSRAVKAPAQRKSGAFTLPPASLLDAPKAERKIDERELMDSARQLEEKCREFAVEGQVAQIHPGPGRHDLRVQARSRREVQQGHRTGRRPVPGDAGRVGAHRPHSRASPRSASRFPTPTAKPSRCASCSSPTPTSARPRSSRWRSARRFTASRTSPTSPRCRTC